MRNLLAQGLAVIVLLGAALGTRPALAQDDAIEDAASEDAAGRDAGAEDAPGQDAAAVR